MKNFLVSVLIVCGLIYIFGEMADHWFVFQLSGVDVIDPLVNFLVICGIAGLLIFIGFVIAVSLFGAVFIGLGAAFFGVLFVGLSVFWPILFIVLLVYLFSNSRKPAHH